MDSFSISNPLSKGDVYENESMYGAYLEDAAGRAAAGENPPSISNETIRDGNEILGTYTVTGDAVHGGMGSVWKVRHRDWGTDLAMKRPQPRFFAEGSERRRQDFVAECEHWIRLGLHPNIVSCYYVREIGGVPTVFSEWMEKGSLSDCIGNGSLYEGSYDEVQERILDIAIQAARGLQYAHENGLVHQDMKPGNLLLNGNWDAKVGDFGLAKAREQLQSGPGRKVSGYTQAYCPKEQENGEEPARWMDIYSWALTVLEMYAGKRSWRTGADAGILFRSYIDPGKCRIAAPDEAAALLESCLKDRPDSFGPVLEKAEEIYRTAAGRPYPREPFEKVRETADMLNNRALSFLDLRKTDTALQMLEAAAHMESAGYNPAKWNLFLLNRRMNRTPPPGGKADEPEPERGETLFWQMEQGNLDAVCSDPLISGMGAAEEPEEKTDDSEYARMLSGLRDLLKTEGVSGRRIKASAGYLAGNRILLGISAPDREPEGGRTPDTMALRLADADTLEVVREFEEPPVFSDGSGNAYVFRDVGKVFLGEKYAYAANMTFYHDSFSREPPRDPSRNMMGLHVWDAATGKYLKYIAADSWLSAGRIECLTEKGDLLYWDNFVFNIPAGTAERLRPQDRPAALPDCWDFPDGYRVSVYGNPAFGERSVRVKLNGKDSGRWYGFVSADPARQRILLSPQEPWQCQGSGGRTFEDNYRRWYSGLYADKHYVCLIRLKQVPYTASCIVAKVRSARQAAEEYGEIRDVVRMLPGLLADGQTETALRMYENVRENYWNLGYNREILSLNPLFCGHALPEGPDDPPCSEIPGYTYIPAAEEKSVSGRRFRIDYTGKGKPYGPDGTMYIPYTSEQGQRGEMPAAWVFFEESAAESHPAPAFMLRVREEGSSGEDREWTEYTLPEGLVYGVFVSGDEVLFQVSRHLYEKSDYRLGDRPAAFKLGETSEMYRLTLPDGKTEKIGDGPGETHGAEGGIFLNGMRLHDRERFRKWRYFRDDRWCESISSDGRLWMLSFEKRGLLLAPNWKWKPAEGESAPGYTSVSDTEESRKILLGKGVHLRPF